MNIIRPYLIIPKLIIQPTWGGKYIAEMKGWQDLPILQKKNIGQSYEFFSETKLLTSITDTSDPRFVPEIGFPDTPGTIIDDFDLREGSEYINLKDVFKKDTGKTTPLLIKFTQSLGNSFQLHVKNDVVDVRWKHKAESWYYFEPGLLTFGIRKGISVTDYKNTCHRIANFMNDLSKKVKNGTLNLEKARNDARVFVKTENPWQYVNFHEAVKYEIIDQGLGGIHHSWEEDLEKYPLGNVLLEVQEDVMDPVSTVRAFDQGKIKDDGSIREIHVDDYFKFLDSDEEHNDLSLNKQTRQGNKLLITSIYSMDVIEIDKQINDKTEQSFAHLFIREGAIELVSGDIKLKIGKGHSCFIPKAVDSYSIIPVTDNAVVIKTYLTNT